MLSDLGTASAELEAQARDLERILEHINDQRRRCDDLVYYYKSLVAPIVSVPSDILLLIFEMCNLDTVSAFTRGTLIDTTPVMLSSV